MFYPHISAIRYDDYIAFNHIELVASLTTDTIRVHVSKSK